MFFSAVLVALIFVFDAKECSVGSNVSGIILGLILPLIPCSFQDLFDDIPWKSSFRKLERCGYLRDDPIRISFAYLFRIKINDKYMLIYNPRTKKYQPVGGVYKILGNELTYLKNNFKVADDNKLPMNDDISNDYRLLIPNKYLRKFVRRFNSRKAERERISNVSREFIEELGGILNWNKIEYRYCGRCMPDLKEEVASGYYKLQLADIVELIPTEEQKRELVSLKSSNNALLKFASSDEIKHQGIVPGTDQLGENISDNGYMILQEEEQKLLKAPRVGDIFTVDLK